ncbi:hypothetical protein [Paenibacillus solani]|uniref:Uncharacterized protein n=1 Tax=Paenibacillus solani TaxID=1705565 RepID=A0A0M1P4D6_9BACL|nr:hypothetical protein [Paenibacillus solani]KOR89175.1 hypothetical protein AM231_08370 [Paenibacillus solani]
MSKKIDVYSDGSSYSQSLVKLVQELACSKCEITIHHIDEGQSMTPSIWMDGKQVDVTKYEVKKA